TARGVAERAVGRLARKLGKRIQPSRTATTVLPGAGIADHEALAIETARDLQFELELPTIRHLIARYAESGAEVVRLMAQLESWRNPVASGANTVGAEVIYVIRHEMSRHLSDIVIRRTGLGDAGHPGADAIRSCAVLAAEELGWDDARVREEIAAVEQFYSV
ncbi:MAG: hypothetical protein LC804_08970, partial [Acidobacteria bacterium]|nr:hypothetical protein [Acidobacteriota bacterium]